MPLQNRMNPMGQLHSVKAKGLLMGNRGQLHNAEKQIVRSWKLQRWITCALEYHGIKRELMAPNSYTELFFLDEPTSYATGHRPCGYCRKDRYKSFKAAWAKTFPDQDQSAAGIDNVLHAARMNPDNSQRTWQANLAVLPDGTIVEHEGQPVLLWRGRQWRWSFDGYTPHTQAMANGMVSVLTPEPIIALFRNGLAAELQVHPSAEVV
ncbi:MULTISPECIES: hypothetical protein [Pseudomonadaceae]|nr:MULTISPECIES: hypothetical protein [Pseudomonadaceae]KRW65475.1 hypothetical protein AO729_19640 [Pseudomonas sp. TTU2014-066ASC]MBH3349026.1 hypothetical protein [Pseudomonas putida]